MQAKFRTPATLAATALTTSLLAACAGMMPIASPEVPATLAVPAGNKVAFVYKGEGLLNYECRAVADKPGTFSWVLASPDAALKDKSNALVGKYYGGPTWEHADGSKVTGKQLAVAPSPAAGNIPWQLVQATPSAGPLIMNGVTYIQRVNTNAGTAPADACTATTVAAKQQSALLGGLLLLQVLIEPPRRATTNAPARARCSLSTGKRLDNHLVI